MIIFYIILPYFARENGKFQIYSISDDFIYNYIKKLKIVTIATLFSKRIIK